MKQYGLGIGDVAMIPTPVVREALRRFHLGLLPSQLSLTFSRAIRLPTKVDHLDLIGAVIGAGYGYETSIAAAAGLRDLIRAP